MCHTEICVAAPFFPTALYYSKSRRFLRAKFSAIIIESCQDSVKKKAKISYYAAADEEDSITEFVILARQ